VWSNLAGTYVGLGDHQRAAQTLEQALLASPPRPDIYVELLRLYVNARQYDKADTLYHRALLEFPQNEQLQFLHAALEH
jgi:tetratricopeptide (TPR) repeat protein